MSRTLENAVSDLRCDPVPECLAAALLEYDDVDVVRLLGKDWGTPDMRTTLKMQHLRTTLQNSSDQRRQAVAELHVEQNILMALWRLKKQACLSKAASAAASRDALKQSAGDREQAGCDSVEHTGSNSVASSELLEEDYVVDSIDPRSAYMLTLMRSSGGFH